LTTVAAAFALTWSFVSLVVSRYVYDHSELISGRWLTGLLDRDGRTWATIHAGLDAEVRLDGVMPGQCLGRLDIFDRAVMTSPSIARARRITATIEHATPCSPKSLALADASCDSIVVAFTAHEIRDPEHRKAFFQELHRALRPGGRAVLVEHLRDWPNFMAFGPGFLHFVARREWLSLAAAAELSAARELRITPWIMALALERPH
jgi:SAM-dependent methyltransferase